MLFRPDLVKNVLACVMDNSVVCFLRLLFILLYISLLCSDLFLESVFCNKDRGYTVKKNGCFMIMGRKGGHVQ